MPQGMSPPPPPTAPPPPSVVAAAADSRKAEQSAQSRKPKENQDGKLTTVFVGGLRKSTTEDKVAAHFAKFGQVDNVDIKRLPDGTSRGFAFVKFIDQDATAKVIDARASHMIDNKWVAVRHHGGAELASQKSAEAEKSAAQAKERDREDKRDEAEGEDYEEKWSEKYLSIAAQVGQKNDSAAPPQAQTPMMMNAMAMNGMNPQMAMNGMNPMAFLAMNGMNQMALMGMMGMMGLINPMACMGGMMNPGMMGMMNPAMMGMMGGMPAMQSGGAVSSSGAAASCGVAAGGMNPALMGMNPAMMGMNPATMGMIGGVPAMQGAVQATSNTADPVAAQTAGFPMMPMGVASGMNPAMMGAMNPAMMGLMSGSQSASMATPMVAAAAGDNRSSPY